MNIRNRCFLIFLFLTAFFILSGCGTFRIGVSQEEVNVDKYPSSKEFLKNQNLGSNNLSEPEFLAALQGEETQKLTRVNKAEDIQKVLFGNITPQINKDGIADISEWILSHHVFILPYKNVRTEFAFDWVPISYNIWEFGPDLNLLFITKKNEDDPASPYLLVRTIVAGTENTKTKTKEYIWQGLGTALIGAARKLIF